MSSDEYLKCTCPRCFEEVELGACRIMSTINNIEIRKMLTPQDLGYDAACRNVDTLDGAYYTSKKAQRECNKCNAYLLPYNIELVPSLIIAVVGDTFSGKSHYILALLDQLEKWRKHLSKNGIRMDCLTTDLEKNYHHLKNSVFSGGVIAGTPKPTDYIKPLIYKFSIGNNSPFRRGMETFNLMIYDVAGEVFTDDFQLLGYGKFALYAHALIFVADPVPINAIFDCLDPNLTNNNQSMQNNNALGREPREVVEKFTEILSRQYPDRAKRSFGLRRGAPMPIAIMLSKADLLERMIDPSDPTKPFFKSKYSFMKDPPAEAQARFPYGIKVDLQDLEIVNKEVEALLDYFDQGDLLGVANTLQNTINGKVQYFATSAMGQQSAAAGGPNTGSIRPRRCLDPFLWILYRLGILQRK